MSVSVIVLPVVTINVAVDCTIGVSVVVLLESVVGIRAVKVRVVVNLYKLLITLTVSVMVLVAVMVCER